MPIKVTKYLCQHKCGHKAMSKEKDMARHENTCWFNPELKTCKSCKFEYYIKNTETHDELEGCHSEKWMERDCRHPVIIIDHALFEKLLKERQYFQPKSQFHINPIINCPFWESKLK